MAGRTLAGPRFPGDDGSAGPRAAAALAAWASGRGSEHAVLAALDSSRLMVPVVAVLAAEGEPGPGGLRREKSSEMALPTVIGNDGRAALPAFTSTAALARWRPGARPVPVPAAEVWRSGARDAHAVVIDIAGPVPFAVDGARLAALAQGRPPPEPYQDPEVMALAYDALEAEPVIAGYRLLPGEDEADLTLYLIPVPGRETGDAQVLEAARRASRLLLDGAGDRVRRGIQIGIAGLAGDAEPGGAV